jgi:altronate hydrolase
MYGAEQLLMDRAVNETVFEKTVSLINDFKDYFIRHNQVVYENPSPGNKKGGITTLEEKSLGCTQKSGLAPITDCQPYGGKAAKAGVTLLSTPGNDLVASTALAAAGCHMVLFTTGRGTPFGTCVPTVKISTNSDLSFKKPGWIDFDAGTLLSGDSMDALTQKLLQFVLQIAEGAPAKNEQLKDRQIAIFKNGVTL